MTLVYRFIIVLALCCININALAQADLGVSFTPSRSFTLSNTSISAFVRNDGNALSGPFRIKVWASFDLNIDDNDLVAISSAALPGLEPFDVTLQNTEVQVLNLRLPLPAPDDRQQPRLVGDGLSPRQWIGRGVYIRACIMDPTGNIEVECQEGVTPNTGRSVTVAPPIVMQGLGRLNTPVASNGISSEFIELHWPVPRTDNGAVLIDQYLVTETDFDGNTAPISFNIADLDTVIDPDSGESLYRAVLTGREPGRRYQYNRGLAVCLESTCTLPSSNTDLRTIGNTYARLSATTNLNGRIEMGWEPFSNAAVGYYVTRCTVGQPNDQCVELATLISATEFVDTQVERGLQYIYTVDVCDEVVNSDTSPRCRFNLRYRIGVSSPGESGLVDAFEDDDNAQQANLVDRSVSQLRSFDTPADEDWVKVVISKAQSIVIRTSGETSEDTEITLFDSNLNELDQSKNTPGVMFASFATLITDELEPGEYFAKINQETIPGLPPQAVFNYVLDIEFEQGPVIISPIINLLLDD